MPTCYALALLREEHITKKIYCRYGCVCVFVLLNALPNFEAVISSLKSVGESRGPFQEKLPLVGHPPDKKHRKPCLTDGSKVLKASNGKSNTFEHLFHQFTVTSPPDCSPAACAYM